MTNGHGLVLSFFLDYLGFHVTLVCEMYKSGLCVVFANDLWFFFAGVYDCTFCVGICCAILGTVFFLPWSMFS